MDFLALVGDHTPSGPTLGGPNTGSTIAGTLLGSPVENVVKVGTILPLPYQSLCPFLLLLFLLILSVKGGLIGIPMGNNVGMSVLYTPPKKETPRLFICKF